MIDRLDRQILHALCLDPRIGYVRLAAVLGISEQTVARRYQRMRAEGLVRVIGLTVPVRGAANWMVRLAMRPGSASAMAAALARRPDVSWIGIAAGGSELTLLVRGVSEGELSGASPTAQHPHGDLLHRLPQASNVLSMSAHQTLHRFTGRGEHDWIAVEHPLSEKQRAQVLAGRRAPSDGRAQTGPDTATLPADRPLLEALARDGRAGYAALAAQIGWPQRQVARRVAELVSAGSLYFDVDVAVALVGFHSMANLWLTVEPARLQEAGQAMADHAQVPFVAAVTGSQNLQATVLCPDAEGLYRYVTTTMAAVEGVRQMEISPVHTPIKQAGSLVENGRLTDPLVTTRRR